MSAMLIAPEGAQIASAATQVRPQGTAMVAFHSFSKEVMDSAQDGPRASVSGRAMPVWFG